jgi:hypothetical protein
VRRVYASPPSLVVDPSGDARRPAVLFGQPPDAGPWARRLGFAWHADAQRADGGGGAGGTVSARAWLVTVPHWFIVLLGVPMPLLWLRRARGRRDAVMRSQVTAASSGRDAT